MKALYEGTPTASGMAASPTAALRKTGTATGRTSLKVLVAEDDVNIANLYQIALGSRGHEVVLTNDGKECLDAYLKDVSRSAVNHLENVNRNILSPFSAIVLDYRMPKMNGLEAARQILSINPKERIVFASAHVIDTLADSISGLGRVVELIQKPFEMDAFVDLIEDVGITKELEDLNVNVKRIMDINPTREQLRDLLEGLRRIQKGRVL
jgi:CheY-like chemotaxis protein